MISPLQRVPLRTLASFLEAVASHPHADEAVIASFAGGLSRTTAKRALPTLAALGLIERESGGRFVCHASGVRRGIPQAEANLIIRRALQGFRPFEALCEGVALGETEQEAIRRTGILLDADEGTLRLLIGWGEDLGIFHRSGRSLCLAAEVSPSPAAEFDAIKSEDVESEARARLYNAARLGRDANNFLDETDRALLAEATLKYRLDPPLAVEKSGQALEDYLREVAGNKGFVVDAKSCNGAGQLGALLVSKGLIHSHLNQFVQAIATARNTTAHRKDKKTMQPWEITPHGAFWAVTGALVVIRSVHDFIYGGKQRL